MFKFQVTIDRQPRSKNGQPAHSTTGVPSTSCTQGYAAPSHSSTRRPTIGNMASRNTGIVNTSATQNRRVMSRSSESSCSAPATATFGSNAIPQIGQAPGAGRSICGCIGQV